MARQRLTNERWSADMSIPYPGNVNQPERKDHNSEEYHTFEPSIENHELQDLRTEWQDNPRDEIGFGVPKVAAIRAAATKAVKMAVLYLGDKVSDSTIEAQARDFMRLGPKTLDASLQRFAKSEELYGAETPKTAPETAPKTAPETDDASGDASGAKGQGAAPAAPVAPEADASGAKKPAASRRKAEMDIQLADVSEEATMTASESRMLESVYAKEGEPSDDEPSDDEPSGDVEPSGNEPSDSTPAPAETDEDSSGEPSKDKGKKKTLTERVTELEEEVEELEQGEKGETTIVSSKRGIRTMSQLKLASTRSSEVDLSKLWETAPDINKLF